MARLSRRHLLRGAAGVTLALPWLEAMGQPITAPKRIVFVFTANGDHTSRRFTTKGETGFVFDDMLSPFQPYRAQSLFVEGIDKYHGRLPDGQRSDGHQQGGSALAPWKSGTGSFPIGGSNGQTIGYVQGPSLDKAIGDRLLADVPSLKYRHLNFRVGDNYNDIWNQHSHAGPVGTQAPIPPQTNPFTAYTSLFGNLDLAGQAAAARRLAKKQSALDALKGDLDSLKPRLSSADRSRLELHTTSLRDVERTLSSTMSGNAACAPLTLPATVDVCNRANYALVGNLFFRIINLAFACDLVRSVAFNWSGNTSDRTYSDLGMTEGHHTISHNSDAAAFTNIRAIKKNLFAKTTLFYDMLKATPEGAGTVWDNTLVVNWSELDQGDTHGNSNNLVVLSGGAGGYFRMGRYVNAGAGPKDSFSNLLISCWQYMGYNLTTWGDPLLLPGGDGPMPGLT
jgi:hypothetical protein